MPSLKVIHNFRQPPEQVFDAWLDPASARQWLFATEQGTLTRVEIDSHVGGEFTIERVGDMDAVHRGEYLEVDRPGRLVFTFWVEPYSDGQKTVVALDFAPDGAGGTQLTLNHDDVPEEWVERTIEGWGMILGNLEQTLNS